jgi:hypothetical protein
VSQTTCWGFFVFRYQSPHQSPHQSHPVVMTLTHLRRYPMGRSTTREKMRHKMMDTPNSNAKVYEIRLNGHLEARWVKWFDGLAITLEEDGDTLLTGPVVDQAALHGLLKKVRDLGMPLVSVIQVQFNETHPYRSKKEKK